MKVMKGKQSLEFEHPPYLKGWSSVVGEKEGEGPLGQAFDQIQKAEITKNQVRHAFAGDLLEQIMATSFGIKDLELPLFGLYGACSTAGESISLASMTVAAGYADYALALASSHIGSAEKQFRFPLEYGSQRPLSSTWTVTGAGGFVISKEKSPGHHNR